MFIEPLFIEPLFIEHCSMKNTMKGFLTWNEKKYKHKKISWFKIFIFQDLSLIRSNDVIVSKKVRILQEPSKRVNQRESRSSGNSWQSSATFNFSFFIWSFQTVFPTHFEKPLVQTGPTLFGKAKKASTRFKHLHLQGVIVLRCRYRLKINSELTVAEDSKPSFVQKVK